MKRFNVIIAAILVIALTAAFAVNAGPQDVKKTKTKVEQKIEKKACSSCTTCASKTCGAKKVAEKNKEEAKKAEEKKGECCSTKKK